MFLKYRSLTNHYTLIPDYLPLDMRVSVSEKLDGSNFSIIVDEEGIRFASRNQIVDGSWNNIAELVGPFAVGELYKLSKEQNVTINLYGEVFSSKILRRIPYGAPRVRFFDMALNGQHISGFAFAAVMSSLGLGHLIVDAPAMTLREALALDIEEMDSDYADSIAEGIVIKPFDDDQITERVPVIKMKSAKFAEMSGVKKSKQPVHLTEHQIEFCKYINESRILSYISKEGEPTCMEDMGKYIKGILADAMMDYHATLTAEEITEIMKGPKLVKAGSRLIVPILKARIMDTTV